MECFGDIRKVSTVCSESSLRSYTSRFATTRVKSEIIVTESANLVTKYDVGESLKTIQSWSFDELNKLHIPLTVSYSPDAKQERFIGLHSGNRLVEWHLNEQNELKQIYERTFKVNVAAILTFPVTTKFDALVVFSNGGVGFFEQIKSDYFNENMTSVIDKNETIVRIESHISQKDITIYFVVKNKSKNGVISVYKSITSSNSTETILKTEKLMLTEPIDAWTFSRSIGQLIGVSKVENKLNIYSIEPSAKPSKHKNLLYSFDSSSIDSVCSIATCSNGAVCLLGKKGSAYLLEIYEINYSTKIGELSLTDPILPNDFCVLRDNVLITSKTNIIIVPILKQKILLSQLLTKNLYTDGTSVNNNEMKLKNSEDFKIYLGITDSKIAELTLKKIQIVNRKFSNIISSNRNGIPEEIAADLFNFCTENYLNIQNNTSSIDVDNILAELKHFFRELVILPINEIFLVSCLKSTNIKLDQYLLAIELLLDLIPCKECSVIGWLSALLDANFRKFIIKPSQKEIDALNRIYDHLSQSIRFYEDLEPIKTLLDSLIKREKSVLSAISNEPTTTGQYSIELISFS